MVATADAYVPLMECTPIKGVVSTLDVNTFILNVSVVCTPYTGL